MEEFRPSGILLGGQLQCVVYWFAAFFFDFLCRERLPVSGAFFGFVVLATLTGLLHEDGFADSLDSLGVLDDGSPSAKESIERALKDSRLGSFGVSGLILVWLFRWALYRGDGLIWAAGAAVLFSRTISVGWATLLIRWTGQPQSSKMSGLIGSVSPAGTLASQVVALLVAGFVPVYVGFGVWPVVGSMVAAAGVSLVAQFLLSRRLGKISGDFVGASICVSELTQVAILVGFSSKVF